MSVHIAVIAARNSQLDQDVPWECSAGSKQKHPIMLAGVDGADSGWLLVSHEIHIYTVVCLVKELQPQPKVLDDIVVQLS